MMFLRDGHAHEWRIVHEAGANDARNRDFDWFLECLPADGMSAAAALVGDFGTPRSAALGPTYTASSCK